MNSYPDPRADAEAESPPVVYEQPLNERMRTFLRLEFLYTQATFHSEFDSAWSARARTATPRLARGKRCSRNATSSRCTCAWSRRRAASSLRPTWQG